jgi:phosphoribosylformimino-5-aminoimidazole carboxamide ribotide isomerase
VVVGVDVKGGEVAVRGWTERSRLDPLEVGRRWAGAGVRSFVYTEISRDGVMTGVDLESTARFARATCGSVVASGGVGSLEDLRDLKKIASAGIEGVIVGRALYEKVFTLSAARRVLEECDARA